MTEITKDKPASRLYSESAILHDGKVYDPHASELVCCVLIEKSQEPGGAPITVDLYKTRTGTYFKCCEHEPKRFAVLTREEAFAWCCKNKAIGAANEFADMLQEA